MSTRFDYVKYDDDKIELQNEFKAQVQKLESMIDEFLGRSREQSLAVTKLEECYMWIGKGIKIDQEDRRARGFICTAVVE